MLFDVDLGEDDIDILEELEDDLETPGGMTLDLQLADDASDLTDVMGAEMYFDSVLDDVISLDPDAIAIAASYQYNIDDTISITDQLTIESAFNTDAITVSDALLVSMVYGVVASDSLAVSDFSAAGFDILRVLSDVAVLTDTVALDAFYSPTVSDTLAITDLIHTWSIPDDGVLQIDLEGDGELNAVLMKRKPPPAVVAAAPPRVTLLTRPPKEITTHNVVNPNPPNREER